jgi:hypothetical protein
MALITVVSAGRDGYGDAAVVFGKPVKKPARPSPL